MGLVGGGRRFINGGVIGERVLIRGWGLGKGLDNR